jgi:neutral amino acid transport system permease protein
MERSAHGVTHQRGRWLAWLALVIGVLIGGGMLGRSTPAHAQTEGAAQAIQGNVRNQYEKDGQRVQEGVPDVRIVVETEDGAAVAEATTDANGHYLIPIDEPGTYVVRLDQESLPEGLTVAEGKDSFTVELTANNTQTRGFFLGQDLRITEGRWSQLPQVLANGLKLATIIAITSIGLSLIFGTTGLSNFAHGEMVTFGAVIAWGFNRSWASWTLIMAALAATVASAAFGGLFELALWRPLRRRGTGLTSMMIVSIGVALGLRSLFLFRIGGDIKQYGQYMLQPDQVSIGPIDLAPRSLWIMVLSGLIIVGVALFLLYARFGKAIRAVSDNPDLASSSGIDADRVILIVWLLGGALAGIGGVFYGLEFGVSWDMGFTLLLLMFAAITLGGLGNPFGALVGSLVIGLMVEFWTWLVPGANDLKNVGALVALIVILLIRPQGILGSKERIG